MHRDQVVRPDELVELDVVHMTAAAELGRVQHREDMIVIEVDLRDVVALDAVAHRELVKAEHIQQHRGVRGHTDRHIHPDQRVRLVQQRFHLLSGMSLNTRIGDRVHVHAGRPFPSCRASPRQRASSPPRYVGAQVAAGARLRLLVNGPAGVGLAASLPTHLSLPIPLVTNQHQR